MSVPLATEAHSRLSTALKESTVARSCHCPQVIAGVGGLRLSTIPLSGNLSIPTEALYVDQVISLFQTSLGCQQPFRVVISSSGKN